MLEIVHLVLQAMSFIKMIIPFLVVPPARTLMVLCVLMMISVFLCSAAVTAVVTL